MVILFGICIPSGGRHTDILVPTLCYEGLRLRRLVLEAFRSYLMTNFSV